jgi:hypothetical protein
MKKIIRLTESDLTRIVKRIINEMEDVDVHSTFKKLQNYYEPKGFTKKVYDLPGEGPDYMELSKGDDRNGSYIQFYSGNNKFRWGKDKGGKSLVSGEMIATADNGNEIYKKITSSI